MKGLAHITIAAVSTLPNSKLATRNASVGGLVCIICTGQEPRSDLLNAGGLKQRKREPNSTGRDLGCCFFIRPFVWFFSQKPSLPIIPPPPCNAAGTPIPRQIDLSQLLHHEYRYRDGPLSGSSRQVFLQRRLVSQQHECTYCHKTVANFSEDSPGASQHSFFGSPECASAPTAAHR